MLFLYRPRETWMPFASPHAGTQQYAYNRQLQNQFQSTRRVPAAPPAPVLAAAPAPALEKRDPISALKELGALHATGVLTDAEFAAAKAKVLGA